MKRRYFVLGAAGALAAGGLYAVQPRKQRVQAAGQGKLPAGHRVAVIGGGLAGLSCALELAERGAAVTLFEAAPHFGGKLGGWPVRVLGEDFPMEHGFHGFFSQYYNLSDVLTRLGVDDRLAPARVYPIAFASGGEEQFSGERRPFPLNLLSLYWGSQRLKWRRMFSAGPPMRAMLEYSDATYAQLDGITFAEYAKTLDPELVEAMLWPFAKTTLNDPANTSAAHVLRFMHFYFLGNPEGLSYRYTREDCMSAVITPWVERLRKLGVRLRPGTRVDGLAYDRDRVVAVQSGNTGVIALGTSQPLGPEPREVTRDSEGAPIFAYVLDGQRVAVRGACTHMGCPLKAHAKGFDCPCHGGRFDLHGVPFAGPPQQPLQRVRLDDKAPATLAVVPPEPFDDVVVACDVRGAKRLVPSLDIAEAAPYMVVRAWLDKQAKNRHSFYTTTGFKLLDSIAVYEQLQDAYEAYARRTGHGVVELHAYGISDDRGLEANRELLLRELRQAMPELKDARVLDSIAMQQSNFSGFAPGSHAKRPSTVLGPNLFLAGDWVKTPHPVALMEAAVTTGRQAANAILSKHGAEQAPIDTVATHGVLT